MRKFPKLGFSFSIILFCFTLVFSQGCARSILQTHPASDTETAAVEEAFARFLELGKQQCPCCLDAEADITLSVSGWFSGHAGKFSGYLQAMEPGYIRFVAVNPLGQPLVILATDGRVFQGFNIFTEKAFTGSTKSQTYSKFAPQGFNPESSYYWLTGRLEPENTEVEAVMRGTEQGKFWLRTYDVEATTENMILFDPINLLILRHVKLNEQGEHIMDAHYNDYRALPGMDAIEAGQGCKVPTGISVSSQTSSGEIAVKLSAFLGDAHFSPEDFHLNIPENFEKLPVR